MGILPSSKSEKNTALADQVILVYGRPKLGKSTLCAQFEDAVFLATEAGLNHLEVFKVNVNSWDKFLEACGELAKGEHKFKTIVIDTIDNLITYCQDYICKENGVDYVGDMPHGRGWGLVNYEVKRALIKLASLPYGIVIVSHCRQEEIETKTKKYSRFTVDLSGKNQNNILKMVDMILFMDSEVRNGEEVGVVRTKPSLYWDAGDKSKMLPESIYYKLDNPAMAFETIAKAFNNK